MATHVLLNNVDHKDLKVIRARSADLGDNIMYCIAYHPEFRDLQAHYPIVFMRNPKTGDACGAALLGLERGENLFLLDKGWDGDYVPMALEMQPFLIGFDEKPGQPRQSVIHIDMDSPRINNSGEPVFLPMGGNTPYLEHISTVLDRMHSGFEYNSEFIAALDKYELLEPFALDIELVNGSVNRLAGFHTINEEKLYALGGAALGDLNDRQFLQAIFMAVASLSNFTDLIRRKNAKVAARVANNS